MHDAATIQIIHSIAGPATTCASEGYTGANEGTAKNGLTGQVLDTWILSLDPALSRPAVLRAEEAPPPPPQEG